MRARRRTVILALGGLLLVATAASPPPALERLSGYLARVGTETRIARPMEPETVRLQRPDGLTICADFYPAAAEPDLESALGNAGRRGDALAAFAERKSPATVLLLHAHVAAGRKHPLYRMLASRLSAAGVQVLVPDFAGFGDSDDPFEIGTLTSLDPLIDVETALAYLHAQRAGPVHLVGHSAGGTVALSVVGAGLPLASAAALDPGTAYHERQHDQDWRRGFWRNALNERRAATHGRGFPEWFSPGLWLAAVFDQGRAVYLLDDAWRHAPALNEPGHVPLLLMDAKTEADKANLYRFFLAIDGPKVYHPLQDADHFWNVRGRGTFVVYDRHVMFTGVRFLLRHIAAAAPASSA